MCVFISKWTYSASLFLWVWLDFISFCKSNKQIPNRKSCEKHILLRKFSVFFSFLVLFLCFICLMATYGTTKRKQTWWISKSIYYLILFPVFFQFIWLICWFLYSIENKTKIVFQFLPCLKQKKCLQIKWWKMQNKK